MSQVTKRALETSLKNLLLKKLLDKITISDITEDCGCGERRSADECVYTSIAQRIEAYVSFRIASKIQKSSDR